MHVAMQLAGTGAAAGRDMACTFSHRYPRESGAAVADDYIGSQSYLDHGSSRTGKTLQSETIYGDIFSSLKVPDVATSS